MKKTILVYGAIALVAIIGVVVLLLREQGGSVSGDSAEKTSASAIVYHSPTCGCCANFVGYLKKSGLAVEHVMEDDMEVVKDRLGIPHDMRSCHTTEVGGYVVEGHMPVEAINKLLAEKPDLKGIALPGMPSGAPGMPGAKQGPFTVYGIAEDGSTSVYLEQ